MYKMSVIEHISLYSNILLVVTTKNHGQTFVQYAEISEPFLMGASYFPEEVPLSGLTKFHHAFVLIALPLFGFKKLSGRTKKIPLHWLSTIGIV
jgi:hypothetical protein